MSSKQEQNLEEQYDADLHEMVDAFRAIKSFAKWAGALFAFILVVVSILLAIKNLK